MRRILVLLFIFILGCQKSNTRNDGESVPVVSSSSQSAVQQPQTAEQSLNGLMLESENKQTLFSSFDLHLSNYLNRIDLEGFEARLVPTLAKVLIRYGIMAYFESDSLRACEMQAKLNLLRTTNSNSEELQQAFGLLHSVCERYAIINQHHHCSESDYERILRSEQLMRLSDLERPRVAVAVFLLSCDFGKLEDFKNAFERNFSNQLIFQEFVIL